MRQARVPWASLGGEQQLRGVLRAAVTCSSLASRRPSTRHHSMARCCAQLTQLGAHQRRPHRKLRDVRRVRCHDGRNRRGPAFRLRLRDVRRHRGRSVHGGRAAAPRAQHGARALQAVTVMAALVTATVVPQEALRWRSRACESRQPRRTVRGAHGSHRAERRGRATAAAQLAARIQRLSADGELGWDANSPPYGPALAPMPSTLPTATIPPIPRTTSLPQTPTTPTISIMSSMPPMPPTTTIPPQPPTLSIVTSPSLPAATIPRSPAAPACNPRSPPMPLMQPAFSNDLYEGVDIEMRRLPPKLHADYCCLQFAHPELGCGARAVPLPLRVAR